MQTRELIPYVGRFAPSPTGPLHFGSLVAAVASYLEARVNHGRWLLRIEDIDPPREQQGATDKILDALDAYGFDWHGETIFQSDSHAAHAEALERLLQEGLCYRCRCSRRDLAAAARGPLGVVYPGTCRTGCSPGKAAIRLRTDDSETVFHDTLQGRVSQRLESESGDFIVRRRDGLIAYHLAVVVDDDAQGVTDIVRGIDLLDSTPRQVWVQRKLRFRTPRYTHIPVITHPNGDKLSKLTAAPAIPLDAVPRTLCDALQTLQQNPPRNLARSSLENIWQWAEENWQIGKLFGQKAIVNLP